MFRTFTCPKHVEVIYENKIVVNCCIKLVHHRTYIYMMHGHTYIKLTYLLTYSMERSPS